MIEKTFAFAWQPKIILGGVLAVLTYLIGDLSRQGLGAVIVLSGLDFITGFARGIALRNLLSRKMLGGVKKLALYLVLICAGYQAARIDPATYGWIEGMLFGIIGATELLSIFENVWTLCKAYEISVGPLKIIMDRLYIQQQSKVEDPKIESKPAEVKANG